MAEPTRDEQIARVEAMEARMDRARTLIDKLGPLLDEAAEFAPEAKDFAAYYGSKQWFADMADADSGAIPSSVKMGVLTEDLPYDVVTEWMELCDRLREVGAIADLRSVDEDCSGIS